MLTTEQLDLAKMIVETLNLEDISPEEIDPQAPLFIDGLGLDSIDALELSLSIKQKYGIQLKSDNERINEIYSSLSSLADYIAQNR
jgi:acyl carrier protein